MPRLTIAFMLAAMISVSLPQVSTAQNRVVPTIQNAQPANTLASRAARLRHGINLSHWFAQASNNDYSRTHLETHTTAKDIALIKSLGFDHVRFTIEPAPLFNEWDDPSKLNQEYLKYLDSALDVILAQNLAVIVDIHPSDEFKIRLNKEDRHVEAFAKFWTSLAKHLSTRDPERVFLEVINEPMVEDPYRWYGIQAKLIAAIRSGAPEHTIIVSGHRWSGLYELLSLQAYSDPNIIYNFHFYEPFTFTHQGATWAGNNLPYFQKCALPLQSSRRSRCRYWIPSRRAGSLRSAAVW
jgi:aryl-phospho-beta-D-glucosidase BglC (GH1 family)